MTDYPQATPDITEAVKAILENHKGKDSAIKRDHLTFAVFRGECLGVDDAGNEYVIDSYDRRIRDAIAEISKEAVPIIWDKGYFIPLNEAEAKHYKLAMISRLAAISERIRTLEDYLRQQAEPVQVEQLELLEV